MTWGEAAQLITSVATLIGVLRVTRKVDGVHKATNSLVDRLVKSTAEASQREGHAKGLKEGQSK
jgi:hypothetical protein